MDTQSIVLSKTNFRDPKLSHTAPESTEGEKRTGQRGKEREQKRENKREKRERKKGNTQGGKEREEERVDESVRDGSGAKPNPNLTLTRNAVEP